MTGMLQPSQMIQLQSFWNLIQSSDEGVQKELYVLLQRKYAEHANETKQETPSFLQMQGILKGEGNEATDRQMLDEYLQDKYNV